MTLSNTDLLPVNRKNIIKEAEALSASIDHLSEEDWSLGVFINPSAEDKNFSPTLYASHPEIGNVFFTLTDKFRVRN